MVPSIRRNFDEGGRPDKWEPLSAYTVKIRGNAGPILIRTKRLMQVATQINIWDVTSTNAVIRDLPEEVWYGKVHQEGYESGHPSLMASLIKKYSGDLMAANKEFTKTVGSGIGAPTIPARPFFVFQPEDEAAIDEIFIRWLAERVEQAWPS
jgi:phage gpG-like protein